MSTTTITNFSDAFHVDKSLVEYEHKEIFTTSRDLNGTSEIRFDIINENSFTLPSDSYLQVEGEILLAADDTALADAVELGLVKEAILYLFRTMTYSINDKQVESIDYPGICQNMLSYLLESNDYDNSTSLVHCGVKDTGAGAAAAANLGYARRKAFITASRPNRGQFGFSIPLRRLFGFFRDYNKVVFGTTQRLTIVPKGQL